MYKYALTFVGGIVAGFVAAKLIDKFVKEKEFEPEEDAVESAVEDWDDFSEVEPEDAAEEVTFEQEKKDYSSYAEVYTDSAKKEHPEDDFVEEPEINEEIKKYKKPRLIKEEEYGELAGIEKQTLKYWTYDDVLTTEENEELKDQEFYVGDCLTKYGFKDNDEEREIFVRNGKLGTDYDIVKFDSSFAEWGNR